MDACSCITQLQLEPACVTLRRKKPISSHRITTVVSNRTAGAHSHETCLGSPENAVSSRPTGARPTTESLRRWPCFLFSLHRFSHAVAVFTLWGPIIQDMSTSISTRKRLLPPQSAFHDPVPRQAVILRKLILKTRPTEKKKQHCPQMLSPRPSIGARPLIGAWGLSQVTTSVIANKTGHITSFSVLCVWFDAQCGVKKAACRGFAFA